MPCGVRRSALATIATTVIALAVASAAWAGTTASSRRGALAERAPDPRRVRLRVDLHRGDLPDRRGGASPLRRQLSPRQAGRDRRRAADPRLRSARADLDGAAGRRPRNDRCASSSTSCRASSTRQRRRGRRDDDPDRRPPVLLAVQLPGRRRLDRPHGRAGRPGRERGDRRATTTTSSTRGGCPTSAPSSTRSRARQQDVVQGAGRPRTSRGARSSAASSMP